MPFNVNAPSGTLGVIVLCNDLNPSVLRYAFDVIVVRDVISLTTLRDIFNIIFPRDVISVSVLRYVFNAIALREVISVTTLRDTFNSILLRDAISVIAMKDVFKVIVLRDIFSTSLLTLANGRPALSVGHANIETSLIPGNPATSEGHISAIARADILDTAQSKLTNGRPPTATVQAKVMPFTFPRSLLAGVFHGDFSPRPVEVGIVVAAAAASPAVPPGCPRFLAPRNLSSLLAPALGVGHVLKTALLASSLPNLAPCPVLVARALGVGHVSQTVPLARDVQCFNVASRSVPASSRCAARGRGEARCGGCGKKGGR